MLNFGNPLRKFSAKSLISVFGYSLFAFILHLGYQDMYPKWYYVIFVMFFVSIQGFFDYNFYKNSEDHV